MKQDRISPTWEEKLLQTCNEIVRQVCPSYEPSYSPTRKWDEYAFEDMASSWILDVLIDQSGSGGYRQFFLNLPHPEMRAVLTQSFRWHLLDSRERNEDTNLKRRVKHLLPQYFQCFIPNIYSSHEYWGKPEWKSAEPFQGSEESLAKNPSLLAFPIFYYPKAAKLSPILSTEHLPKFITAMMDTTLSLFSPPQIVSVINIRFNLSHARLLSIYEAIIQDDKENEHTISDMLVSLTAIQDEQVVREEAQFLFESLSSHERQVFLFWVREVSLREVKEQTNEPKSTISAQRKRLGKHLKRQLEDEVEPQYRLAVLCELHYMIGLAYDIALEKNFENSGVVEK